MKNNAMKSEEAGLPFVWTDDELMIFGIGRQEAHLAWLVLFGISPKVAMSYSGYGNPVAYSQISCTPKYMQAMRVMTAQYLNAVVLPEAIRDLQAVANDTSAPSAARVQAAGRLIDYAMTSLDKIKAEQRRGVQDIDIDELADLIKRLENERAGSAKPVESVQTIGHAAQVDDYLTDLIE